MNRRLSKALTTVAQGADREMTAVDICRRAHLPPGGIYDVLMKATRFGRVTSRWEHVNEAIRPRNRLYRLTPDGKQRAAEMSAPP